MSFFKTFKVTFPIREFQFLGLMEFDTSGCIPHLHLVVRHLQERNDQLSPAILLAR